MHVTRLLFFIFLVTCLNSSIYAEDLTIATFNTEFLSRKKVHIKFGKPFYLSKLDKSEIAIWSQDEFIEERFLEAVDRVAKAIAEMNVDIITLTEIGDDRDFYDLQQAVKKHGVDYPYKAICICRSSIGQHVAVLSKFPITEILGRISGTKMYNTESDDVEQEESTGISKGLKVKVSAYGHNFHIYVLHFVSERGGHDSDQLRVAQASIVRRHFLKILESESEYVIVTGDLNDKPGEPTLKRIRGFDDIGSDLIQTGFYKYFSEDELDTRWTHEFRGTREQIDHILLSGNFYAITGTKGHHGISTRTFDPGDPMVSDHRALIVTLDIIPYPYKR